MKRKSAKIICLAILSALLIGIVAPGAQAMAANTKLNKKDTNAMIKFGSTFFSEILTPVAYYAMSDGAVKAQRGVKTPSLNFAKAAGRRSLLKYRPMYDEATVKEASMAIFGKNTKKADACISGEWGDSWPQFKNFKVYQTGDHTYKVKADIYFEIDGTTICTVTMNIKESPDGTLPFQLIKKMYFKYNLG